MCLKRSITLIVLEYGCFRPLATLPLQRGPTDASDIMHACAQVYLGLNIGIEAITLLGYIAELGFSKNGAKSARPTLERIQRHP